MSDHRSKPGVPGAPIDSAMQAIGQRGTAAALSDAVQEASHDIASRNEQARTVLEKKKNSKPIVPPAVAFAVIGLCAAITILQAVLMRPNFDESYELDTFSALFVGDHCMGLLDYHINEERRLDRSQLNYACPSPLQISDTPDGVVISAPEPEEYGFVTIEVQWKPLEMNVDGSP